MKIIASLIAGIVAFAIYASYALPLSGQWLDTLVSLEAGRLFPARVAVSGTRVAHWSKIYFDSIEIYPAGDKLEILKTGPGLAVLRRAGFSELSADVICRAIAVRADSLAKLASFKMLPLKGVPKLLNIDVCSARLSITRAGVSARAVSMTASEAAFNGGLDWANGGLQKAHGRIILSDKTALSKVAGKGSIFNSLLSRTRLSRVKLFFKGGRIVLRGPKGPLLDAQWS